MPHTDDVPRLRLEITMNACLWPEYHDLTGMLTYALGVTQPEAERISNALMNPGSGSWAYGSSVTVDVETPVVLMRMVQQLLSILQEDAADQPLLLKYCIVRCSGITFGQHVTL